MVASLACNCGLRGRFHLIRRAGDGLHLLFDQPRLLHDLVQDGADVGADGAEEAQAVASGARIDLQQNPTHRAEFHRPPPAALLRRPAPDARTTGIFLTKTLV